MNNSQTKPESYITKKSVSLILIGIFVLFGLGLAIEDDLPKTPPRPHRYPWQNRCDDACAATLGGVIMKKYDGEDCDMLRRDRTVWLQLSDTKETEYVLAVIADRLVYESCK